ncbi:MAG: sensor histidine kinase, partial [Chloroflexota bacterium]
MRRAWGKVGLRGRIALSIVAIVLAVVGLAILAVRREVGEVVGAVLLGGAIGIAAALVAGRLLDEAYSRQRQFVSDASHELRTPLTTIRGNAALLRRVANMDPVDREEALQQISGEAERMSRLVTDLLTLARADGGLHIARRPVAARPIVEEVHRQLRMLSDGRSVELGVLADGLVRADPDYLKQVLL